MSFYAVGLVDSWQSMKAIHRGIMYELANRHNSETGKCHPSHEYLAKRLDTTVRSVIRLLNACQELGYLEVVPQFKDGRQTTNNYIIKGVRNVTDEGDISVTPEGDISVTQKQEEETVRINNRAFEEFWSNYPRKVNKKKAQSAFNNLTKEKQQQAIVDCKDRYKHTEPKYIPHPTTYLNGERWEDETIAYNGSNNSAPIMPPAHKRPWI